MKTNNRNPKKQRISQAGPPARGYLRFGASVEVTVSGNFLYLQNEISACSGLSINVSFLASVCEVRFHSVTFSKQNKNPAKVRKSNRLHMGMLGSEIAKKSITPDLPGVKSQTQFHAQHSVMWNVLLNSSKSFVSQNDILHWGKMNKSSFTFSVQPAWSKGKNL